MTDKNSHADDVRRTEALYLFGAALPARDDFDENLYREWRERDARRPPDRARMGAPAPAQPDTRRATATRRGRLRAQAEYAAEARGRGGSRLLSVIDRCSVTPQRDLRPQVRPGGRGHLVAGAAAPGAGRPGPRAGGEPGVVAMIPGVHAVATAEPGFRLLPPRAAIQRRARASAREEGSSARSGAPRSRHHFTVRDQTLG